MEELFFVEKADLEWSEDSGKRVRLKRPLRKGSVVFVRLLQSTAAVRSNPIAYEVEPLRTCEDGLCEFRLDPVSQRVRSTSTQIN